MHRGLARLLERHILLAVAVAALPAAAAVAHAAGARESQQLTSAWRDRDVRVDGNDEEWRELVRPVKGHHFAVGFLNDADALYFCLVTKDQDTVRQVAQRGLILWIDVPGGKKHAFGLRFPVTYGPYAPRRSARAAPPVAGDTGGAAPRGESEVPGVGQREIEVLGPGRNDVRSIENGGVGVTGRLSVKDGLLVYELRVPLRKGDAAPFAPGVDAGAVVKVGLQTPEWRGPLPPRRGGLGVGVGVRGGGLYFPGPDMAMLKPIDISAELKLASQ